MPTVNPQCQHISASSISAFKACPQRFRLQYREGLRPDRDTDSQRQGTAWHGAHETYANAEGDHEAKMVAAISYIDARYHEIPSWKDAHDWALEKQVLVTCLIAYYWYWQNDPVEFLASEVPFNLPLHEPRTGMPLSMKLVQRVGKIDHIVKWHDSICSLERKSTSKTIGPDSGYWEKGKKDTQVSMYALAFQDMVSMWPKQDCPFPTSVVAAGHERFGNTLYDVWKKPTIKPCMLTQAETKAFIETGVYQEQTFDVVNKEPLHDGKYPDPEQKFIAVGEELSVVEMGKKGFAIRETVEMFAARLLQDIYARPDHYFARREIARTAEEIREFRGELFAIYQAMSAFNKGGFWFSNESQCRATFPCSYIPICYGPGASAVCDGKTTPASFKRIFVDLTVKGQPLEEE